MSFNYRWTFKDYPKEKNGYKVYSTFACGGGSTMGYKLAGYDVIGANDVDPKMKKIYLHNHKPKLYHFCDIRDLITGDIEPELFDLDILDGSPPCTTFSLAGKREDSWGEKRKYAEGAVIQTLDDLYFSFIRLAKRLQPKIVVSENVSGLAKGKAIVYLKNILRAFNEAGYDTQTFILNGATMGVPQRRERLFVLGKRKDLNLPKLELSFNEPPIKFGEYRAIKGLPATKHEQSVLAQLKRGDKDIGTIVERITGKRKGFNMKITWDDEVCGTIPAAGDFIRACDKMKFTDMDYILSSSFPTDYDFLGLRVKYVVGMSVPPLMIANIAQQIQKQWLDLIK